jgi:hypothetical protein
MQFTGKLTEDEYKQLRKLTRPIVYWLRLLPGILLAFWSSVFVLVVTFWCLAEPLHPAWRMVAITWLVFVSLIAVRVFVTRRIRAARFARFNAKLSDQLALTDDGVKLSGPNDANGLLSWHTFKRWREGRRVVLLYLAPSNGFIVLPVTQLADAERESLREYLRAHIAGPGR